MLPYTLESFQNKKRASRSIAKTGSDIAGSRYYAGESSVLEVNYFFKCLCFFLEAIWTALAWSKHTFEGELHRFAVFRFRFFRLSARVCKIHEKHSFYRSDFPEWRSCPHNNTIRVVPVCFLVPFGGAFGTPLGALGLPLAPLWLAFGPPWHLWELWRRT